MGRQWGRAGKQGRATHLEDRWVALDSLSTGCNPENFANHATHVVSSMDMNSDLIDLYSIKHSKTTESLTEEEVPFVHDIHITGHKKGKITIQALFNGGTIVSAMSMAAFYRVQNQLSNTTLSKCQLQMANGAVLPSQQRWEGPINLGQVEVIREFEVFDSKGGWDFQFRKPLL